MTPGCTTQAVDFDAALSDLAKAGYQVVGISPDAPAKLAAFREQSHLGFPLLADPEKAVLKEYGVSDTATGENAAWGETTPEKVVADWMASEGHRVNIMDPAAKYMCLGYNYDANSQWGHNWIQIFAK